VKDISMLRQSLTWVAVATMGVLAACGGDDDDTPNVSVDNLDAGAYVVSTGDANTPTIGRYLAGTDGSRLLVLDDADEHVGTLYRRSAGSDWTAVPAATSNVRVTLLRSSAKPVTSLDMTSLAGNYVTLAAPGVAAAFTVSAGGRITATGVGCRLSGSLSSSPLPNALQVSLTADGCGSAVPASTSGVLVVDAEDAPARFRLITDNGSRTVDLRAFAE
jgi:hypothetical protein